MPYVTACMVGDCGPRGDYSDTEISLDQRKESSPSWTATTLGDLLNPPGNHLEALKGDRQGQHSIRINQQYRLCFIWEEPDAIQGEIVDYH